ncbi:MAG: type II toxin-antitoxin system RelE/ParE family toxin [Cyclobacteriaceae bacterium]|nr:type II toxin-antitoxin system RelE/ParE family toxin [Cyclobacteriaceae bacterium]
MEVVITDQSLTRLEKSLHFYITELEMPVEKAIEIKDTLLRRARSLSGQPYKGQFEPYLTKLNQGHRRLIEGNFKIVYRIENDMIYVVDFFDSHQEPNKLLKRNK